MIWLDTNMPLKKHHTVYKEREDEENMSANRWKPAYTQKKAVRRTVVFQNERTFVYGTD